jgi:aspartate aminotransferase-like enzyme
VERPEILMAPGPTPIPPEVLLAQGSPLVYHRGPGYGALLREVTEGLQEMMKTSSDVLCFTSSGTGGLESAVANLLSPGDRVVVPVAGYFGERFGKIAKAFGADVRVVDYEWGTAARAEDIAAAIDEAPTKAVLAQHSETSTGVIHDIEAMVGVCRDRGVLFVVDVISSLGAVPYDGDRWGIDVAVGGSQKALSASPGIAFVSVNQKAWEATETARNPRFYFDWKAYKDSYDLKDPENPWTPAVHVMMGVRAALRLYYDEGQEAVLVRHQKLSEAVKAGVRAMGLELSGEHLERAWAVTAVKAPEGIDGNELVSKCRADHGVILAPGQGPMKGKVFRIGHLGNYDRLDIIRGLSAIEQTLASMGHSAQPGAAVAAAEAVFAS